MDAPPPITLWIAAAAPTEKLFSVQIDGAATIDELAAEISRRDSGYNPTGLALYKVSRTSPTSYLSYRSHNCLQCRSIRLEPRSTLFSRIRDRVDAVTHGVHSHSSDTDSQHSDGAINSDSTLIDFEPAFERLKEYKSVRHYFSPSRHGGRIDVFIDVENVLPATYEDEHPHGLVSTLKGMFGPSKHDKSE